MPNYEVVDADQLDADLTTIANAIRSQTGGTDPLTLDEMAVAVENIQSGDTTIEDGLITGTLTEYTNDRVESVGDYAFYQRRKLTKAQFSNAKTLGTYSFYYCAGLVVIDAPNITKIGERAFYGCSSLESVSFPNNMDYIQSNTFYNCSALEIADVGFAKNLVSASFQGCTILSALILRKADAICALNNVGAFTKTPFASGGTGGTVYVPAALIEQYQTATNWSTLYAAGTCNFVAIEGSEYE